MRALFYTVPSERCGKRARDGVGGCAVTSKQSKTVAPLTDDEDADEEEVDEKAVPGRGDRRNSASAARGRGNRDKSDIKVLLYIIMV